MGSLKGNISKFFAWIMVSIVIVSLAGFGIQDVILGSSGRNIATVGKEKITVNDFLVNVESEILKFSQENNVSLTVEEAKTYGLASKALNDLIAKKFGLDGLKQLEENLGKQVKGEFEQAARVLLKKQLMDKLERELKFELPESLVTAEANSIAMQKNDAIKKSAAQHEKPNVTKEDKKIAERRVRVGLFFAEYGIKNKLDLSEAELNAAYETEARKYPGHEQDYLKFVKSNLQAQQAIRGPLFEEKVVNSILETVTLKDKKLSVEKFKEQMDKLN